MREIKFRVWNRKLKRVAPENCSIQIQGDYSHVAFDTFDGNFDTEVWILDDCELMQYTGLKDVNGIELYEGDLYKHWGAIEQAEFDQVIYDNMQCTLLDGDFEIIGNIYENPELLEGDS